jgi:hypothetical protein
MHRRFEPITFQGVGTMSVRFLVLFCALGLSLQSAPSLASADADTIHQFNSDINDYEKFIQFLRTMSFDFSYSTYETGGRVGGKEVMIGFGRGSASVCSDEFRIRERQRYLLWYKGDFQRHDMDKEDVQTAKLKLHLQANYPISGSSFPLTELPESGGEFMAVEQGHASHYTVEKLHIIMSIMYGHLACDLEKDMSSIMRSAQKKEVNVEPIDDHSVRRVTSHGIHGTYSVWLDPADRNAPRRITIRKSSNSLYYGDPLASYPISADPGDRHPHEPIHEYVLEVDKVALAPASGSDIRAISGFEVRETLRYKSGSSFVIRNVVNLSNIRFGCSEANLKPVMVVPNGTAVAMRDAPSIDAEWRDGSVVRIVDAKALKRLQGLEVSGGGAWLRHWWLFTFNAVLMLALIYYWARHRRQGVARD